MEAGGVVKAREEGTGGRGDSGVEVEIRVQLLWCPIFPLKISPKNCPSRQAAISEKSGKHLNKFVPQVRAIRESLHGCLAPLLADETIGE